MPECIRIVGPWTGAGQQHYLAGHDRLEALVHQLDADSPLVLDEDATRKRYRYSIVQGTKEICLPS
jgi:hypothetical protein